MSNEYYENRNLQTTEIPPLFSIKCYLMLTCLAIIVFMPKQPINIVRCFFFYWSDQ